MQSDLYCTPEDVAHVYGVKPATVRDWCRRGVLDGVIRAGRQFRIPRKYMKGDIAIVIPDDKEKREGKDNR